MRITIFLLIFLSAINIACAQSIFYGLPKHNKELKKGDLVILNLPHHLHGKFEDEGEIDSLISFVKNNLNVQLRIQINVFLDSQDYDQNLSDRLKKSLLGILQTRCENVNYYVIALGRTNPIFLNAESRLFSKMNTRLEIAVE